MGGRFEKRLSQKGIHNFLQTGLKIIIKIFPSFLQRDANVFIVDWGKGASVWNYLQVAANTRVVGAELKRYFSRHSLYSYLISKHAEIFN